MENHFASIIEKGHNYSQPQILTRICYNIIPSSITSNGILADYKHPSHFLKYSLPLLELQIAIICVVHHTLHFFLKRFGITDFVSQILTGIILGPTFLGRCEFMRNVIFPHDSQEIIWTAAHLGFVIFVFLSAVKLDLKLIFKRGKMVIYTGVGNVLIPLMIGLGLIAIDKENLAKKGVLNEAINVAILQSLSTFSIIAHVLEELKILNSKIGRLVLSSALIGGILCIVVAIAVTTLIHSSIQMFKYGIAVLIFNLAVIFVFHPAMLWVIGRTPQGSPVNSAYIVIIMAIVLLSQVYFRIFHQFPLVGVGIIGYAIPAGPPLGSALVDKFQTVATKVLVPIYVAGAIMRADLTLIVTKFSRIEFYIVLSFAIVGSKFVSSMIASFSSKMPLKDSYLFAATMTCRGAIELSTYVLARDTKTIGEEVYAFLVFSAFVSSATVSIIMKYQYDPSRKYAGYQKRSIASLRPNSELRILACIHKPDNVTSFIGLLDAFHPAKDRPTDVCVIHLIELIGQFAPMLISHQIRRPITNPRSQNVIVSFTQYQQNNWETVTVSTYTSITIPKLMNEDISMLAFDKLTSLILLPLHRRWSIHGNVEAEDKNIRTVNCKVLETAPCSVGIFFDRGKFGRPSTTASVPEATLSICMIFLGGGDDRDALSLAKRIAKDRRANVTVIRFIPDSDSNDIDSEDTAIDSWALDEIKQPTDGDESVSNIVYREELVKDGPETALLVHSVMDEYDLFILGRRHGLKSPQTDGLSEWTELPELGIVGDLFASKHINTRAAVLVVQQQKQIR